MGAVSTTLDEPHFVAERDARPIRATSANTLWDRAIATRDEIVAKVKEVLADEGVEALVLTSQNGVYPPWVRLEAWLPDKDPESRVCQHADLNFVVDIAPFHKFDLVTTARLKRGNKSIEAAKRPEFSQTHVAQWTRYAIDRGPVPNNYSPRVDALLAILGTVIRPLTPHRNPVLRRLSTKSWGSNALIIGAVIAFLLINAVIGPQYPIVSLLAFVGLIVVIATALLSARKRRHIIAVHPQPIVAPRHLGLVDSWHVLVSGLGPDHDLLRQRLLSRFSGGNAVGIDIRPEIQGYRTPNGYEERERLTLSKGQSVVHALIHRYGDDLFVGWHANLNWAKWGEFLTGLSKNDSIGQTEFLTLRPSIYEPNLFDLMDLNGLSDFVHRQFEQELKALLTERAIDQEIDFEIVRGDRNLALNKDRHVSKEDGAPSSQRWSGIMSRAAEWQQTSITEKYQTAESSTKPPAKNAKLALTPLVRTPAIVVLPAIIIGLMLVIYNLPLTFEQRSFISPGAAALAIGLWLYGETGIAKAIAAFVLATGFAYLGHSLLSSIWSYDYDRSLLFLSSYVISSLSWLIAGSIFSPAMRNLRLWIMVTFAFAGANYLTYQAMMDGSLARDLIPFVSASGLILAFVIIGRRFDSART